MIYVLNMVLDQKCQPYFIKCSVVINNLVMRSKFLKYLQYCDLVTITYLIIMDIKKSFRFTKYGIFIHKIHIKIQE